MCLSHCSLPLIPVFFPTLPLPIALGSLAFVVEAGQPSVRKNSADGFVPLKCQIAVRAVPKAVLAAQAVLGPGAGLHFSAVFFLFTPTTRFLSGRDAAACAAL